MPASAPFVMPPQPLGRHGLWRSRRGSISLLVAVALPAMAAMAGVGLEVSQWALASSRLQRAADAAAMAGATYYAANTNAQKAAGVAADLAELNGIAGATARIWSSSTQKLTDGSVVVALGAGVTSASYTSVKVIVTQTVASSFSAILNIPDRTLTATAAADAVPGNKTGEACLLALDTLGGIKEQDIIDDGSSNTNLMGCAMRANASIRFDGSPTVNAGAILSSGNISVGGSSRITATTIAGNVTNQGSTITGTIVPPAAKITDPYASNAAIGTALAQLNVTGRPSISGGDGTTALKPGSWSSWSFSGSGSVTLSPGLYVVTGDIRIDGSMSVTGTGVTIVHGGTLTITGSNRINLTAPGTSPTNGAVPAVLLASRTASSVMFDGSNSFPMTGVIYYPNTAVGWSGSTVNGSSGCLQLIARTISIGGSNSMAANCTAMGALSTATGTSSSGKLAL